MSTLYVTLTQDSTLAQIVYWNNSELAEAGDHSRSNMTNQHDRDVLGERRKKVKTRDISQVIPSLSHRQ